MGTLEGVLGFIFAFIRRFSDFIATWRFLHWPKDLQDLELPFLHWLLDAQHFEYTYILRLS